MILLQEHLSLAVMPNNKTLLKHAAGGYALSCLLALNLNSASFASPIQLLSKCLYFSEASFNFHLVQWIHLPT